MNKEYKSELLGAIHETMHSLHEAKIINPTTMRQFDEMCLTPIAELNGKEIRAIREQEQLTQATFAMLLNVSKNHVSAWERDVKKPSGTALKLLTLVKNKGIQAII